MCGKALPYSNPNTPAVECALNCSVSRILFRLFSLSKLTSSFPQFRSVTPSCPTLCDPIDCSMPGFPVHHQLPELVQIHVHRVGDAVQPSVVPFSSCLQSFPASGSFPVSQCFSSGGQSIGASALASVLPLNIRTD